MTQTFDIFGRMVALSSIEPPHCTFSALDLSRLYLPAIRLGQYYFLQSETDDGCEYDCAFITWAYMSEETIEKFFGRRGPLMPSEWQNGETMVIVDFVAPFGHATSFANFLRREVFVDDIAYSTRYRHKRLPPRIVEHRGVNYKGTSRRKELQQLTNGLVQCGGV